MGSGRFAFVWTLNFQAGRLQLFVPEHFPGSGLSAAFGLLCDFPQSIASYKQAGAVRLA
jgi:hypothetical protein